MRGDHDQLRELLECVGPSMLGCSSRAVAMALCPTDDGAGNGLERFAQDPRLTAIQLVALPDGTAKLEVNAGFRGPGSVALLVSKRPGFHEADGAEGPNPDATNVAGGVPAASPGQGPAGESNAEERSVIHRVHLLPLRFASHPQEGSFYEELASLIQRSLMHAFSLHGERTASRQAGLALVHKRAQELHMAVQQCRQDVTIPAVELPLHPIIEATIEKHGPNAGVEDLPAEVEADDLDFAGVLYDCVKRWMTEVQRVVLLRHEALTNPGAGTLAAEINYWRACEKALLETAERMQTPGVLLTVAVLRRSPHHLAATQQFDSQVLLGGKLAEAAAFVHVLKDLPLQELLSADSGDALQEALKDVYKHMKKRVQTATHFPVLRSFNILEMVAAELAEAVLKLAQRRGAAAGGLLQLPYNEFTRAVFDLSAVFGAAKEEDRAFREVVRELLKKRGSSERAPARRRKAYEALELRLEDARIYRDTLYDLEAASSKVFGGSDRETPRHLQASWAHLLEVDLLDMSQPGAGAWEEAKRRFDAGIKAVDERISNVLRLRLEEAPSSTHMFREFSRFSPLLARPAIREAVAQFQDRLLEPISQDMEKLQQRYRAGYKGTAAHLLASARDVPEEAGVVMWARQLEVRLHLCLGRLRDVLGRSWQSHTQGQRLAQKARELVGKLDQKGLFDEWQERMKAAQVFDLKSPLFVVLERPTLDGGLAGASGAGATSSSSLEIVVNYDRETISLFRDVRLLQAMRHRVPYAIRHVADDSSLNYPFAATLQEAIRIYMRVTEALERKEELVPLLAGKMNRAQERVLQGMRRSWESVDLEDYTAEVSRIMFHLEESSVRLETTLDDLHSYLGCLQGVDFAGCDDDEDDDEDGSTNDNGLPLEAEDGATGATGDGATGDNTRSVASYARADVAQLASLGRGDPVGVLHECVRRMQALVDRLYFEGFTNVDPVVARIDSSLQQVLTSKLRQVLQAWAERLLHGDFAAMRAGAEERGSSASQRAKHQLISPEMLKADGSRVSVVVYKGKIQCTPPLDRVRATWTNFLNRALSAICDLHHLEGQSGKASRVVEKRTFWHLINDMPTETLAAAYRQVGATVAQVEAVTDRYLNYANLWEVNKTATAQLESMAQLKTLLDELHSVRNAVVHADEMICIGPVVVDTSRVKSRILSKCDEWTRHCEREVEDKIRSASGQLSRVIAGSRRRLEAADLDAAQGKGKELLRVVVEIQQLTQEKADLELDLSTLRDSYRALGRGGGNEVTVSDAVPLMQLEAHCERLWEDLSRKERSMQAELPEVRRQLHEQQSALASRLDELYGSWRERDPARDSEPDGIDLSRRLLGSLEHLVAEATELAEARASLGLDQATGTSTLDQASLLRADLEGVQRVSEGLAQVRQRYMTICESRFQITPAEALREQLEQLIGDMREMDSTLKQYEAFQTLDAQLAEDLGSYALLQTLRSPALQVRHWTAILERLHAERPDLGRVELSTMSYGYLLKAKVRRLEPKFADILRLAQGEMGLQVFLNTVREHWAAEECDFATYKGRRCLLRRWDELFAALDEHLAGLAGMRMSPYAAAFDEDIGKWEERLGRVRATLDVWLEVQRKWVYLEGIFSGSADIQVLLPAEFTRFRGIDGDFMKLLKDAARRSKVVDCVIQTTNLHKTLERLLDQLSNVQRALGEYLEQQRALFPRFYFVGDEDLLEMIGNGKDISLLSRHLSKMFAGLTTLEFVVEGAAGAAGQGQSKAAVDTLITGMASREHEKVTFGDDSFRTSSCPLVNQLLNAVDTAMKKSLGRELDAAVERLKATIDLQPERVAAGDLQQQLELHGSHLISLIDAVPCQVIIAALQVTWTRRLDAVIGTQHAAFGEAYALALLSLLASLTRRDDAPDANAPEGALAIRRVKVEQLITEAVHQRDVAREVNRCRSSKDFAWQEKLRFKLEVGGAPLVAQVASATFDYGYEYLGLTERLVQTPLTDLCYLTLATAMHLRMGGNPNGPAGTGKTETVKALGAHLGRHVLVFCCDESFDVVSMGRIFVGVCQVGAYGCFDEFNRLTEQQLSTLSGQIQAIQCAMRERKTEVMLLNKQVKLHPGAGIFVTMNPGYAGRSELPDNLKALFRPVAMVRPDKKMIAQVILFAQGFRHAEMLARKMVLLFDLCLDQLSRAPHYDFGLRALKSVLSSAGTLQRRADAAAAAAPVDETAGSLAEQNLLVQSISNTVVPKLVQADSAVLRALLISVFPDADLSQLAEAELDRTARAVARGMLLDWSSSFAEKVTQLHRILQINHGVMLVGSVGTGKSASWRVLLRALSQMDEAATPAGQAPPPPGACYVIDAKAVRKEELFGVLDSTTIEWKDGVFTQVLRNILTSLGLKARERQRRHWIVFDGDVDPEWAENLNSVLDDNKLLTLPNGERLEIPPNVRILFEVDSLKHATLATVSRCGMVWYSDAVVNTSMICQHELSKLAAGVTGNPVLDSGNPGSGAGGGGASAAGRASSAGALASRRDQDDQTTTDDDGEGGSGLDAYDGAASTAVARLRKLTVAAWKPYFGMGSLVPQALELASELPHILAFTEIRAVCACFSLLRKTLQTMEERVDSGDESLLHDEQLRTAFAGKSLVSALLWSFGGSLSLKHRSQFAEQIAQVASQGGGQAASVDMPTGGVAPGRTLLDYEPSLQGAGGDWLSFEDQVPRVTLNADGAADANLVVSTVDTLRHQRALGAWLEARRPFVLCGPPGSGKSMTLMATLKSLPDVELASLNFSAGTTPDILIQTLNLYCECSKQGEGYVMRPKAVGKWLAVFCDEINLPQEDKYGTQKVLSFMRGLTERGGFYRPSDLAWVRLENVQFLGACNPPTDAGRWPMSDRFQRHTPVLFVDYPAEASLMQIYRPLLHGVLSVAPDCANMADELAEAMVQFYLASQERYTTNDQPHYLYSPRELTRWKVALLEAVKQNSGIQPRELVRLWLHEGLRIFHDRLVSEEERGDTENMIDEVMQRCLSSYFTPDLQTRPVIFSRFPVNDVEACSSPSMRVAPVPSSAAYTEVSREALRDYVQARLDAYCEEEMDMPLVLFDDALDHISRIDRVLRQPLGHLLLVGASGTGKTVLTRFVSWMNRLSVYQIRAGRNYDVLAFENDLRGVMRRAGVKRERITFIFDESNALGPAFLERMNALLACGEVPGLFEGDEYSNLISECKQEFRHMSNDEGELFAEFTCQVQRNLHIVFTMNPQNPDFHNRGATSPALFNRCVIDWFGDWSPAAIAEVGRRYAQELVVPRASFQRGREPEDDEAAAERMTQVLATMQSSVVSANVALRSAGRRFNYITPRDFLDLLRHTLRLGREKRDQLTEQKQHLDAGLSKLVETEAKVAEMRKSLATTNSKLQASSAAADQKMDEITRDQSAAELKKSHTQKLRSTLEDQSKHIAKRQQAVADELSGIEPKLAAAREAVSRIDKAALTELKSLSNPPQGVVFVAAAVASMTSGTVRATDWGALRKEVLGNVIRDVLEYDADKLPDSVREALYKNFLGRPEWDMDKIKRSSSVAYNLAVWCSSQMEYATINRKIAPLRAELEQLQEGQAKNTADLKESEKVLQKLTKQVSELKSQYKTMVQACQKLEAEKSSVQEKCDTATRLLDDLGGESRRWKLEQEGYGKQANALVGDILIGAAECTYLGYFDYAQRQMLRQQWKAAISGGPDSIGLQTTPDRSALEYVTLPAERLQWRHAGLGQDELSCENGMIIARHERYPLVIDPSGDAGLFIQKLEKDVLKNKLIVTSFGDRNFLKQLESSLRFGTRLMVQDVEKVDPILNSVLNRETQRRGGRVLIVVGDQEVDFSPAFSLYLTCRDPDANFSPDLCSRVTFVNFSVSPSSLEAQCLATVLHMERPDVDCARAEMQRAKSELTVQLREREEELLGALSKVKGSVLDDAQVQITLAQLKEKAGQVQKEMARADEVLRQVASTTEAYAPFAGAATEMFVAMEQLADVDSFYQYDLAFFMDDIFKVAVSQLSSKGKNSRHDPAAGGPSDDGALPGDGDARGRVILLTQKLAAVCYAAMEPGLLQEHRLVLALRLAHVCANIASSCGGEPRLNSSLLLALISKTSGNAALSTARAGGGQPSSDSDVLTEEQINGLTTLPRSGVPPADAVRAALEDGGSKARNWLQSVRPEEDFSLLARLLTQAGADATARGNAAANSILERAVLIGALRQDRLASMLARLPATVVPDFKTRELSLAGSLAAAGRSGRPLLLASTAGFDPSSRVEQEARAAGAQLKSVALGTAQASAEAMVAAQQALRQGSWLVVKNAHLATEFLSQLERMLFQAGRDGGSRPLQGSARLIVTIDYGARWRVPANMLRMSEVVVLEAPAGVRSSLERAYGGVLSASRPSSSTPPAVRAKFHLLVALLHAAIVERERYAPLGWTQRYHFSDSDQAVALHLVDEWLDAASNGGQLTSVPAERLPLAAVRSLLSRVVYGGRVSNSCDQAVLSRLVSMLFTEEAIFQGGHELLGAGSGGSALLGPEGLRREELLAWVEALPGETECGWLGLMPRAERLLDVKRSKEVLAGWGCLENAGASAAVGVGSSAAAAVADGSGPATGDRGSFMSRLVSQVDSLTAQLPQRPASDALAGAGDRDGPLRRTLNREAKQLDELCGLLSGELHELRAVAASGGKLTAQQKAVSNWLAQDVVPTHWRRLHSQADTDLSVAGFVGELLARSRQLEELAATGVVGQSVWLGGLFSPDGLLVALRQQAAADLKISIDSLSLQVVPATEVAAAGGCRLRGLTLEAAGWEKRSQQLLRGSQLSTSLPDVAVAWRAATQNRASTALPLYVDASRKEMVTQIPVEAADDGCDWLSRGTALILWSKRGP